MFPPAFPNVTAASLVPSLDEVMAFHSFVLPGEAVFSVHVAPESVEVQMFPPSTTAASLVPSRERALGSTTTKLFGNDDFQHYDYIRTRFAIVESSAIVQRDLLRRRYRTGTRTNGLIFCCAQSYLRLCINSTKHVHKNEGIA